MHKTILIFICFFFVHNLYAMDDMERGIAPLAKGTGAYKRTKHAAKTSIQPKDLAKYAMYDSYFHDYKRSDIEKKLQWLEKTDPGQYGKLTQRYKDGIYDEAQMGKELLSRYLGSDNEMLRISNKRKLYALVGTIVLTLVSAVLNAYLGTNQCKAG